MPHSIEQRISSFLKGHWPYFWIAISVFLLYSQTLFFGFTSYDDTQLINESIRLGNSVSVIEKAFLKDVFTNPSVSYQYRPVSNLVMVANAAVSGSNPFGYHLVNIFLHMIACLLLFSLLKKILKRNDAAFLFSLVFALHPAISSGVAWVPGRIDMILAIFVMAAFLIYIDYAETKKLGALLAHYLFFALAMFTKEIAAVMVILFPLYRVLAQKEKKTSIFDIKLLSGWIVIGILWFAGRTAAISGHSSYMAAHILTSMITNLPAVVLYIGKALLPFGLSVMPILADSSLIWGSICAAAIILLLFFSKKKDASNIVFGIMWFILFLIPSFIRPNPHLPVDLYDYRIYVPFLGVFIVIYEIDFFKQRLLQNKAIISAVAIILIVFASVSFLNSRNYRDDVSFWFNAAATSPDFSLSHSGLGTVLAKRGMLDDALLQYKIAIGLNRDDPVTRNNIGNIFMAKSRFKEAESEFRAAVNLNPFYAEAYDGMGMSCYKQKKYPEAEYSWKRAIAIDPTSALPRIRLEAYHKKFGNK